MGRRVTGLASQRRAVIGALAASIADAVVPVAVHRWFPGQTLADRVVWFGLPDGEIDYPVMTAPGRLDRSDEFRVTVYTHAHTPGASPDTTEDTITAQVNAVEAVLAAGKTGEHWPESVVWAIPVGMEGPGIEPHPNHEGWIGYAAVTIEIHARYH